MRRISVTPQVAQNSPRHEGYAQSINDRLGIEKVAAVFGLHVIAYSLIRLGNLLRPAAGLIISQAEFSA